MAVDLLSPLSPERKLLNLEQAVVRGRLPHKSGEIVVSETFAQKLDVALGETATLISSTMYGSMAADNFTVVGTIRFGISALDRGSVIADISDVQVALDMDNAAGEIFGLFKESYFYPKRALRIKKEFNNRYRKEEDEFSPVMQTLRDQAGLGEMLDLMDVFSGIVITIFVVAMSLVLWNAGLIGSLRRYGEIGVRLAIGENKGHLYRSMVGESLMIGFFGSLIGTAIGLAISYYLQVKGLDVSFMLKNSSMMISNVMRSRVTQASFLIGIIPGIGATFFGTSIAGINIFKRQTSQLMKELEV